MTLTEATLVSPALNAGQQKEKTKELAHNAFY
jgi:hypothetical protein